MEARILTTALIVGGLSLGCTKRESEVSFQRPHCLESSQIDAKTHEQLNAILQAKLIRACELTEESWTGNFGSLNPEKTIEIRSRGVVFISDAGNIVYKPNGKLSEIQK